MYSSRARDALAPATGSVLVKRGTPLADRAISSWALILLHATGRPSARASSRVIGEASTVRWEDHAAWMPAMRARGPRRGRARPALAQLSAGNGASHGIVAASSAPTEGDPGRGADGSTRTWPPPARYRVVAVRRAARAVAGSRGRSRCTDEGGPDGATAPAGRAGVEAGVEDVVQDLARRAVDRESGGMAPEMRTIARARADASPEAARKPRWSGRSSAEGGPQGRAFCGIQTKARAIVDQLVGTLRGEPRPPSRGPELGAQGRVGVDGKGEVREHAGAASGPLSGVVDVEAAWGSRATDSRPRVVPPGRREDEVDGALASVAR